MTISVAERVIRLDSRQRFGAGMSTSHFSAGGSSRRFDAAHRRHSGLKTVQHEEYRDWEISLEHHTTGMTIQRDQYSAKIADTTNAREEYLKGYSSRVSAMQAARRRIDFILDIRDPRTPRRRTRRVG